MAEHDDLGRDSTIPDALIDAVSRATGPWIRARVTAVTDGRIPVQMLDALTERARQDAVAGLRDLFALDVEEQRANPLHVLRTVADDVTRHLRDAGVPPVVRDAVETEAFPDDVYGFGPFTWRDLSEEVHETGITWGAWKAAVVVSRRRIGGRT